VVREINPKIHLVRLEDNSFHVYIFDFERGVAVPIKFREPPALGPFYFDPRYLCVVTVIDIFGGQEVVRVVQKNVSPIMSS
jgi:hypothetical protein